MSSPYFQPFTKYDSGEFSLGIETDYDAATQSTLFANCLNPKRVIIRSDVTMSVKFNSTSNSAVTINANTLFELDFCISKIFITTTAATAIKILLQE